MKVAFFADTHIGYAARTASLPDGSNPRVIDGYQGLTDTITAIIDAEVDVVLHGGDLFHVSHPHIADIITVRQQFQRLHAAGIPIVGVSGNHDFSTNRTRLSATQAVHAPDLGVNLSDEPYQQIPIADGVVVHAVAHLGVLRHVDAAPLAGKVNILVSHGVAAVPGHELFACVDSPGEAVLGYELLNQDWSAVLLGHYHQRGPLDPLHTPTRPALYAGSLLRRGFSDDAGDRGWSELSIESDTHVTVHHHNITQRPQFDLPVITADGLSATDIAERILANAATVDVAGAIVRQRIHHITPAQRASLPHAVITDAFTDALQWSLAYTKPPAAVGENPIWKTDTSTRGLDAVFADWVGEYARAQQLSEPVSAYVREHGMQYLLRTETGESYV